MSIAGAPARPAIALRPRRLATTLGRSGAFAYGVVAVLVLWSLVLRTETLHGSFWIDEGLSVGIASHPLAAIPGLLRQDGSPPLYYVLLHFWMQAFGHGEAAVHALSLVFGMLCIPAALWAGWSLFGRRAGLIAAAFAALDPFISAYSQEARMYTLLALFGIVATAAFLHVFAYRRRRHLPLLAISLALALYTHNWALFLAMGLGVAGLVRLARGPDRRRTLVDGAIAAAAVAVLYAPWLPTLLYQSKHTGAPWSLPATWRAATQIPLSLFGGWVSAALVVFAAAAGVALLLRRRRRAERSAVALALVILLATVAAAYVASKVSPAWADRYFATFVGPVLVLVAAGFARLRVVGLLVLLAVLIPWAIPASVPRDNKSNARPLSLRLSHELSRGDLVISTHPEQIPVLHYYLPAGLRYATELGPVSDPRVMDWRDALARLRAARPSRQLAPLLARLPVGARVALVQPVVGKRRNWSAPWTSLVVRRSRQWGQALASDRRFRVVSRQPRRVAGGRGRNRMRSLVYVKTRSS